MRDYWHRRLPVTPTVVFVFAHKRVEKGVTRKMSNFLFLKRTSRGSEQEEEEEDILM